jgi:hypothetical protein
MSALRETENEVAKHLRGVLLHSPPPPDNELSLALTRMRRKELRRAGFPPSERRGG